MEQQPQVIYTSPPQPIVIMQGEGVDQKSTNWFALIIGFLILIIIIMAIVWAVAYQRNESDDKEVGGGSGSELECPKKISQNETTTCNWLRKNSANTRCFAEGKGECTEEIAKKECSILGKWSALDEGKFVCIFSSNKELTSFGSSASSGDENTGSSDAGVTPAPLQPTECKVAHHCNSDEFARGAECTFSGQILKCQRHGICPRPFYNDGGCWMFK